MEPLYYCITYTRSSLSCLLSFYTIPIFTIFKILIYLLFYGINMQQNEDIVGHIMPKMAILWWLLSPNLVVSLPFLFSFFFRWLPLTSLNSSLLLLCHNNLYIATDSTVNSGNIWHHFCRHFTSFCWKKSQKMSFSLIGTYSQTNYSKPRCTCMPSTSMGQECNFWKQKQ